MFKNKIKNFLPSFLYKILKKIYHILRFYNLINPNYSTNNNITFGNKNTGDYLKNKIISANFFLEFGSGNTTLIAQENNIAYYSIESDRNFFTYMKRKKNIKNIFFYSLGFVEFYSYPLLRLNFLESFYKYRSKEYASKIFDKLNKDLIYPDLILVDGRYRVLCMLNIFKFLKKNKLTKTCVVLDDYKDRIYYKIIEKFFNISYSGRLGICYLKNGALSNELNELIEQYSVDPR